MNAPVRRRLRSLALAVIVATLLIAAPATASETLLACDDLSSNVFLYLKKPRRCDIFSPSETFKHVINLRRLSWDHWGRKAARGRGREGDQRVHVRACRPRKVCGDIDGNRAFTRFRARSDLGIVTMRRPTCASTLDEFDP